MTEAQLRRPHRATARGEAGAGSGRRLAARGPGDAGAGLHAAGLRRTRRRPVSGRPRPALGRATAVAALLVALTGCAGAPSEYSLAQKELLENNLAVAAAALAAGQPEVARRLYRSLAERVKGAPEPILGLGYIAFGTNDFAAAEGHFLEAAARARTPALRAEALLGAGRTALARRDVAAAGRHFGAARATGAGGPAAVWIANGSAVVAALHGDYETAETSYAEAVRLSSGHPRITANLVRSLIASGRSGDAARIHAEHDPSYWTDDDGPALSLLLEESRRDLREQKQPSDLTLRLPTLPAATPPDDPVGPMAVPTLTLRLAAAPVPVQPTGLGGTADAPVAGTAGPDLPKRALPRTLTLTLGQGRRLHLEEDATSVLVAAPEVADVQLLSPDVLYVIGKQVGRTSVAVLGEGGSVEDRIVSVVLDLEPVEATLASEPALHAVRARRAARGVALTGEVKSAALAERALRLVAAALPEETPVENQLRVAGAQQVNLEVQIAEVQRSITEDLGINWEAFRTAGDNLFGFRVGRLTTPLRPGAVIDFPPTHVDGQISPGLFFGRETTNTTIAFMIDALAEAGLANVLARPNVTAVSGEPASFFSGGEYPLPTGFDAGVIVFEYKKYGILLDFVPTVIDTGRIVLNVRPEVSEPSLSQSVQVVGVTIPVINVRRAETTVEVGNGESIVIAGLFRNTSTAREAGVPLLKDLPAVGALFGHRSTRSQELELIVIVTARLISAGAAPGEPEAAPARRISGYHF